MKLSGTPVCEQRDNEISISANPAIFHTHTGIDWFGFAFEIAFYRVNDVFYFI